MLFFALREEAGCRDSLASPGVPGAGWVLPFGFARLDVSASVRVRLRQELVSYRTYATHASEPSCLASLAFQLVGRKKEPGPERRLSWFFPYQLCRSGPTTAIDLRATCSHALRVPRGLHRLPPPPTFPILFALRQSCSLASPPVHATSYSSMPCAAGPLA